MEHIIQNYLDRQADPSHSAPPPPQIIPLSLAICKAAKYAPPTLIRQALSKLISADNKIFWQAIKFMAGERRRGIIAKGFNKLSVSEQNLHPDYSLGDYYEDLYKRPNTGESGSPHSAEPTNIIQPPPCISNNSEPPMGFSEEEVEIAIRNTGLKATGIDGLSAKLLKSPSLRAKIVTKLSHTFTEWSNINHFPPYTKKAKIICLSKENTALPSVG